MPNAKDVKKRFLEVKSFADVRDFFVYLDGEFRPHATEDEQGLEIDLTDADYMEVYVYTDRAEIEKRARRGTALRFCQLAISSDFEDWTFTRHGVEGKVKLLKYRIQKKTVREAESPVSMQRLAKLGAGKLSAFEDLFERKDISGKFYAEYAKKRVQLIKQISGIDDEADSRWFAQVLLDRIIFLYFLQKKGILAGDERYLIHKLQEHVKAAGKKGPSYYKGFLTRLFFETLCTKPADRSAELTALTGTNLPYLNGGLFLKHDLEETYPNIDVDNRALSEVFLFLETWMWNVSERSETDEDAIDPYILGYIFEKSLGENKSQGVYYTPPFLSEFLARETIEAHLLRHANQATASAPYPSLPDFLAKAHENDLVLLYEHLRSMTVCDPACGSGQFLVQALHEIGRIHESLLSRARTENMDQLLRHIQKDYAIDGEYVYGMRRFIVARNLYGVDLLSESVEITKLRLFIGMVEGLEKDIREPLPNIDFNIRAGNSLMGFREMPSVVRDSKEGTGAQFSLDFGAIEETFHQRELKILSYYNFADPKKARALKTDIQKITDGLRKKLNNRLDQFIEAEWKVRPKKKIDFVDLTKDSAAKKTWDAYRLKADAHSAFHWVMEFSNILLPEGKPGGGFDVVLLNPPWEILKPNSQEFFEKEIAGFRDLDKNKARKAVEKAFEKQKQLKKEWMEHSLSMSAVLEYYRVCGDYPARGDGAVNLYKLFLERAFSLLKEGGSLGIVMPSGFYSDLGCKDLRALFFEKSAVHFLYGFENRKLIFEDVDSRFKFILLSASKESEEPGTSVPSAFMMHTEGDLESAHAHAPASRFLDLPQTLIRKLAPDTLTIMEFRSPLDIQITSKMARFPALDDHFGFHREFNSTDDAHLMIDLGSLKERKELLEHGHVGHKSKYLAVVYEGKNIWHFTADLADPTKACVLDQIESGYKIAYRRISRSTDRRTLMATLLPAAVRSVDSINVSASVLNAGPLLAIMSCLNSYAPDFFIRMVTNANIHVSVLAPLPVPRFQSPDDHPYFQPLVEKAARLVGTTAAYDDLLREVFGKKADHKTHGVTDPAARQKLKNEIDAMVAKIYDLTEDELTHVLSTFPLVEDEIKQGVLNIYRSLEGSRPPGGRPDEAP